MIILRDYQQNAYKNVIKELKKSNRTCIVHPTGSGKSFIFFKMAEEYREKSFLVIEPRQIIYDTQVEKLLQAYPETDVSNITLMTYKKLTLLNNDEIAKINADVIVLDEFHRAGATTYFPAIKKLLNSHKSSWIFGETATATRYLDNMRNMAEEIFDGNIADEITLGEGIARGITPNPEYYVFVLSILKDIEKLENKLANIRSEFKREELREQLNSFKKSVEMSEGLNELFERHIKNKSGKYIVFCSDEQDMDNMLTNLPIELKNVNKNIKLYYTTSKRNSEKKVLDAFCNDNSKALKLMFSINLLNEGVHVPGIDGVIMMRSTISPILFKQQLGRALAVQENKIPQVFDIANNAICVTSFPDEIHDGIKRAISKGFTPAIKPENANEKFTIFGKQIEFLDVLNNLNLQLDIINFDDWFDVAKKYYIENGNLIVPKGYINDDGLRLGDKIRTWRAIRNSENSNGVLTLEQIKQLESIGMVWEVPQKKWDEFICYAK